MKSFDSDKRIQEMPVLLHLCVEILLEGKEEEVGFENVVHINQGSISPTFYERFFRKKVLRDAFLYLYVRF